VEFLKYIVTGHRAWYTVNYEFQSESFKTNTQFAKQFIIILP